jgi:hypothetical protein
MEMAAGAQPIKGLAIEPPLNARYGRISKSTTEKSEVLARRIIPELESDAQPKLEHDSSTNNLIRRYRKPKESAQ